MLNGSIWFLLSLLCLSSVHVTSILIPFGFLFAHMLKMKSSWIWSFLSLQLPYESVILSSMFCLHMLFKTALIEVRSLLVLRTELTDEIVSCFNHIMSQLMLLQIRTACKALFTCWTLIRLLPCMHSLMSNEIWYLWKCLWTSNIVTNVWLFMIMDPLVLL